MRYAAVLLLIAAVALTVMIGCERKVVNEIVSETPPDATLGCFNCHSDTEATFMAINLQYELSKHATGVNYSRNRTYSSRYGDCEPCHTNEGFVAAVNDVSFSFDYFSRISCFTCHAPHSEGNFELRYDAPLALENGRAIDLKAGNLCAYCHHSRADITTFIVVGDTLDNRWGPHHSTQADMLHGTNGYEYDGYVYRTGTHSFAPNGCPTCHMPAGVYATGGHALYPRDEANDYENVKGCNIIGCHNGNVEVLDNHGSQAEVINLLDSLQTFLADAGLIEEVEDHGEMVWLPAEDYVITSADSVGALFNWLFVSEDRSKGNHNPFYSKDLLISAIQFLNGGPDESPKAIETTPIAAY